MKKLFCLLLVTMLFCMSVCAAEILKSGTCGDNLTWTYDSDSVLTISGTGDMYDYPIRYGLDAILSDAPWYWLTYTSVVVEEGVTSIGECAFYPYYGGMTHVSLPSTLKKIGSEAFYFTDIEELTIPEGVIEIGSHAFESCRKLSRVLIPSTVSSIGSNAFKDCIALEEITVNSQSSSYLSENGVLFDKNKTHLIQYPVGSDTAEYDIPESVTKIGSYAFYNASPKLVKVDIGENVTTISSDSFNNSYVTVYCTKDSEAYYHALENNVLFMCTDSGWTPEVVYSAPCGDNAVWTLYENFVLEITGTGPTDDWEDSSSYSSTSIATPWYPFKNSILKLKVGEGITSLGSYAFCYCSSMRFAELPSSLKTIGDLAFDSCSRLCKADIPSGVTSIGEYAFRYTDIIRVVIPAGVTTIGVQTFLCCDKLESVTFAENSLINTLGQQAFGSCTSLKEFTIPASVGNVGLYQFNGCKSLEKLTVLSRTVGVSSCTPDQFPLLTVYCYENSTAHTTAQSKGISYILIDGSEYTVAYDANGGNGAPAAQTKPYGSSVSISSTKPTKKGYTFIGWSRTSDGEAEYMPGDVYTAGASITLYAVWDAEKYDVIYDANGGTGAPAPQKKIYAVTLKLSDVKPVRENYTFKGWAMTPTGSAVYYSGSNYAVNAPVTLYAVWGKIPDIASGTCGDNLTWVLDGNEILTVSGTGDMYDFERGKAPWYLYSGPDQGYNHGHIIKGIVISDGVTSIGDYAFYNCSEISDIDITSGVTGIGDYAFYGCWYIRAAAIPDSVTSIGDHAFEFCDYLAKVTFGVNSELTHIGRSAFAHTALSEINLPASLTKIDEEAFIYCIGLESIVIPEGVTTICAGAFEGCDFLSEITIPRSVTEIEDNAFGYCYGLTDVYYGGSEQEWNSISKGTDNGYLTDARIHFTDIPETYKVTYDANGGSSAPEEQFKNHNEVMLITSTVPEREGYEFKGWSAEPGGQVAYRPGNAYTDNADITLYAVWEKKKAGKLVYGDISGDETVSVSDVIYMLQFIVSGDMSDLNQTKITAADVNCDDRIDVSDAIRILQYLASPDNTVLGPRGMLGLLRKQGEASVAVNPAWLNPIE